MIHEKGDAKAANLNAGAKNSPSSSSTAAASSGKTTQKPERELGQFHHLPHYVKLYEMLKSAHSNCR